MTLTTTDKFVPADTFESQKELIKRLYCKNCTDDEFEIFRHICKKTGLDPSAKQIYAIKRGTTMTIQTGIDGFRLIAERSGNYTPGRETTFSSDEKGNLLSATAYIKKRTSDGVWHEVAATAYLDEYNAKQGLWSKMPRAMLSKCAEALALRKAFPAELSGIYSKEEMDQANPSLEDHGIAPLAEGNKELEIIVEPDAQLSEDQSAEIDMLLLEVKNKQFHVDKLKSTLRTDSIYRTSPQNFGRIMKYLNTVVSVQNKEGDNDKSNVA